MDGGKPRFRSLARLLHGWESPDEVGTKGVIAAGGTLKAVIDSELSDKSSRDSRIVLRDPPPSESSSTS